MSVDADRAILSIDAAAGLLAERRAKAEATILEPAAEAPVAAPAEEEPQVHPDAPTSDDVPAAEAPGEDEPQQPEPAKPAVEPPHFWDAKAKERFAELTPELQAVALEQWKAGERKISSSLEEAANARKAAEEARQKADAELQSVADLTKRLGDIVPKAEETFKSRWDGINWVALAKDDPDQYVQAKALYDAEQADLQRLQTAKQDADRLEQSKRETAHREYLQAESEKLKTLAPELADPKAGRDRMGKLYSFLKDLGFQDEQLRNADAQQLSLAYDAMKLRDMRGAQPAQPRRQPAPAKPPVRPASGQGTAPKTSVSQAMDRLKQTGSRDDALAVLKAKREARR